MCKVKNIEFKLIDGTVIIGNNEILRKVGENINNNRFSTSSLLSVICMRTKEEYIFSMSQVVYAKIISQNP